MDNMKSVQTNARGETGEESGEPQAEARGWWPWVPRSASRRLVCRAKGTGSASGARCFAAAGSRTPAQRRGEQGPCASQSLLQHLLPASPVPGDFLAV